MNKFMIRSLSLLALTTFGVTGCHYGHHDDGGTSRVRTLKVDEHGHVHDENDGHDHGHDSEKRIASH